MFSCPSQGAILHAPFEDRCYNGGLHQWFSKLASHQKDLGNIKKKNKKTRSLGLMSVLQNQNLRAWVPEICIKTKWNKTRQIILIDTQPKFGNHLFISVTPGANLLMPLNLLQVLWVQTLSLVKDSGCGSLMPLLSYEQCSDSGAQIVLHDAVLFTINTSFLHMLFQGILIGIQKQRKM